MNMEKLATDVPAHSRVDGRIGMFQDESRSLDERMSCLVDVLTALRADLTAEVMPRAARITGTLPRWYDAVEHVDAAIGMTRQLAQEMATRD